MNEHMFNKQEQKKKIIKSIIYHSPAGMIYMPKFVQIPNHK